MAWESLADFFAAYHRCDDWTLQKAVMRCAHGPGACPYREVLRTAAYAWQPQTYFYCTLKRIMVLAGEDWSKYTAAPMPQPLTQNQVTPRVTRVRRELEAWLREHYPTSTSELPTPRKERKRRTWLSTAT